MEVDIKSLSRTVQQIRQECETRKQAGDLKISMFSVELAEVVAATSAAMSKIPESDPKRQFHQRCTCLARQEPQVRHVLDVLDVMGMFLPEESRQKSRPEATPA